MGVWVFIETKDGKPEETSLEVLSEGSRLAERVKEELVAVLPGANVAQIVEAIEPFGPDRILLAEDETLQPYSPEAYTALISGLVLAHDPSIFLFGATTIGNDLAPRIAARVQTGLTTNCDKLQISEEGLLVQTRLCHERKVHVHMTCPVARPQMATIEPGVMKQKIKRGAAGAKKSEVMRINPLDFRRPDACRVNVTGFIKADPKTIDITDAEVIVAGGKGAGDPLQFQCIDALAYRLQAAVAGSRVAVDNGAVGRERQIGQSGKNVTPALLISCGISGANAHTVGMRDAVTVVAINKDKNAPIFKLADLGVVGDLHEIIPVLIDKLDRHCKKSQLSEPHP